MRIRTEFCLAMAVLMMAFPTVLMPSNSTGTDALRTRGPDPHDTVLDDWENITGEGYYMEDVRWDPSGSLNLDQRSLDITDELTTGDLINETGSMVLDTDSGIVKQSLMKTYGSEKQEDLMGSVELGGGRILLLGACTYQNSTGYVVQNTNLVELDASGSVISDREYNFGMDTTPFDAVVAPNGDILIAGAARAYGYYNAHTFVARIGSNGEQVWNKTFEFNTTDSARNIMVSDTDEYAIVGSFSEGWDESYFFLKIDGSGSEISNFTGPIYNNFMLGEATYCIGGGYLMVGSYHGVSTSAQQGYLIKLDADGSMLWNREFGNGLFNDYLTTVHQIGSEDIYIGGYTYSYASSYPYDFWIIKTGNDGVEQWNRSYDNFVDESLVDLVVSDGEITVVGIDESQVYPDMIIMKIRSDLGVDWTRMIKGYRKDVPVDIFKTPGGYLVTGYTDSYGAGSTDYSIALLNDTGGIQVDPLVSEDLLKGMAVSSVYQFEVISYLSSGSKLLVSFSSDGEDWFDSNGNADQWDEILTTPGKINLFDGLWTYAKFYYRMKIDSSGSDDSQIGSVKLKYRQYMESGVYYSPRFEMESQTHWLMVEWTGDTPAGTNVTYQVKSGNDLSELEQKSFTGPNGSMADLYQNGEPINAAHRDKKMFRFQLFLNTSNSNISPMIDRITIRHNSIPQLLEGGVSEVSPDITGNVTFSVNYTDMDGDLPQYIYVNVNGENLTMIGDPGDDDVTDGCVFSYSSMFPVGNHTFHFITSDGYDEIVTEDRPLDVSIGPASTIVIDAPKLTMTSDDTVKFNATCRDRDGNLIEELPEWNVDGGGVIYPDGTFEAVTVGFYNVTATMDDISETVPIEVLPGEAISMEMEPTNPKITTDDVIQFSSAAFDADGNRFWMDTAWSVTGGGTIAPDGFFNATTPGRFMVYANMSGLSAQTQIEITTGLPASVEVTGNRTEINIDGKIQFEAAVKDADGNAIDINIIWSVDGGGLITTTGLLTADTAGGYTVTASYNEIEGTMDFTVLSDGTDDDDNGDDDSTGDDDGKKEGIDPLLIIIPVILMVVIAVVVLLFLMRRKKEGPETEEEPVEELYGNLPDLDADGYDDVTSEPIPDDWMSQFKEE